MRNNKITRSKRKFIDHETTTATKYGRAGRTGLAEYQATPYYYLASNDSKYCKQYTIVNILQYKLLLLYRYCRTIAIVLLGKLSSTIQLQYTIVLNLWGYYYARSTHRPLPASTSTVVGVVLAVGGAPTVLLRSAYTSTGWLCVVVVHST